MVDPFPGHRLIDTGVPMHDLFQWASLVSAVLGAIWFFQRDSKSRRGEIKEITEWRTNKDRDVKEINTRLAKHEEFDNRIWHTLDEIRTDIRQLVSDRLTRIETIMEQWFKADK